LSRLFYIFSFFFFFFVFVRYVAIVYGMYLTMHYDHVGTMYTSENKMLFCSVLLRNSLLPVKYSLSIFQMHSGKK